MIIDLPNEQNGDIFAKFLAECLTLPAVLSFSGDLGAGKTTFIRFLLTHLGIKELIKSPSFSLVESYQLADLNIHHFDLYRIQDESELEYIGFRDYFEGLFLCCIEWPEKAAMSLNQVDLHFTLSIKNLGRLIKIEAKSALGENMLACLAGKYEV